MRLEQVDARPERWQEPSWMAFQHPCGGPWGVGKQYLPCCGIITSQVNQRPAVLSIALGLLRQS